MSSVAPLPTPPELPEMEAELVRVRAEVAKQRQAIAELRRALDQLAFQGVSRSTRWAMIVGVGAGISLGFGGLVFIVLGLR